MLLQPFSCNLNCPAKELKSHPLKCNSSVARHMPRFYGGIADKKRILQAVNCCPLGSNSLYSTHDPRLDTTSTNPDKYKKCWTILNLRKNSRIYAFYRGESNPINISHSLWVDTWRSIKFTAPLKRPINGLVILAQGEGKD